MIKSKLFVLGLVVALSGCFGGGVRQSGNEWTADGGTFNLFTFHWDMKTGGFSQDNSALKVAVANVPSGSKITNVNTNCNWRAMTFPWVIFGLWNEYIIGGSYAQIGGTK